MVESDKKQLHIPFIHHLHDFALLINFSVFSNLKSLLLGLSLNCFILMIKWIALCTFPSFHYSFLERQRPSRIKTWVQQYLCIPKLLRNSRKVWTPQIQPPALSSTSHRHGVDGSSSGKLHHFWLAFLELFAIDISLDYLKEFSIKTHKFIRSPRRFCCPLLTPGHWWRTSPVSSWAILC